MKETVIAKSTCENLCKILTSFWVAAGSAAGGGIGTGPGWRSCFGPGTDLAAATGRKELVKTWWFCSHWGLGRDREFPSQGDTRCWWQDCCLHIASERDSSVFLRAYATTLTSNLRKTPQSTHCPCQPCFPQVCPWSPSPCSAGSVQKVLGKNAS